MIAALKALVVRHWPVLRLRTILFGTLLFVAALLIAQANHHEMFAQQAAANQVRSAQAFEAAEAGIEWTIAMQLPHLGSQRGKQYFDGDGLVHQHVCAAIDSAHPAFIQTCINAIFSGESSADQ